MVCRSIQQLFFDVSKKKTIKEDAIKNKWLYFTNVKYFFLNIEDDDFITNEAEISFFKFFFLELENYEIQYVVSLI
jgi:hypothetical protein